MHILRKISCLSIGIALLFAAFACSPIQEIKVGTIRNVDFKSLKDNTVTLKITLPIENPNAFKVKIKEADLKVRYGQKEIGTVKQIDEIAISSKSTQDYTFTVSIELTDVNAIMSSAFQLFSGRAQDARLTGTVKVKSFMYSKTIKVEDFPLSQ